MKGEGTVTSELREGAASTNNLQPASRRATGPRTDVGKAIASKNALKHGFFSKEIALETRLFKESPIDFHRLHRALRDDWHPVGATEELQIELVTIHLVQYRRLLRFRRAMSLKGSTSAEEIHDALVSSACISMAVERECRPSASAPRESGESDFERELAERIERDSGKKWKAAGWLEQKQVWAADFLDFMPGRETMEWLQDCESRILRNYYRALSELERLQRMRLGERVPPRHVVELREN